MQWKIHPYLKDECKIITGGSSTQGTCLWWCHMTMITTISWMDWTKKSFFESIPVNLAWSHEKSSKFVDLKSLWTRIIPCGSHQVAMKHPSAVTACNLDLENLITDSNRSIATLAITTLLKTGSESSVDRLMKQISSFVSEISDEFKVTSVSWPSSAISFISKECDPKPPLRYSKWINIENASFSVIHQETFSASIK